MLSKNDVREVVGFHEYLRDFASDMSHEDFGRKYFRYLLTSERACIEFSRLRRGGSAPVEEKGK